MWFFTSEGFYSAVEETKLKAHMGQISVRAREPGALEKLREAYMPKLSESSITPSTVSADYRYRAWIDREDFAEGMGNVARGVTYSNFKSEAARKSGLNAFEKALHSVWSIMGALQPGGPYGYGGGPPIPKGEPKPKKYAPAKKSRSKKAKLPLAFDVGSATEVACEDCGHLLGPDDGVLHFGRWLCRDLPACNSRISDGVELD